MRKYLEFGEWILQQTNRVDRFGDVARMLVGLNDPAIAAKNRDNLIPYLKNNHQIPDDVLWYIDFDMFYDGWIDNAGWHAQNGIVYLLKVGSYHKIGVTQKNTQSRIASLQTANPEIIELVCHFVVCEIGDSVLRWERYFHRRFAASRKSGEWFILSEMDIDHFGFIARYYDYIYQTLEGGWSIDAAAVDKLVQNMRETNARNRCLVGKRVHIPKGTPIISNQWEPSGQGFVGRVTDWSDDPFWPSVCVKNKGKQLWVESEYVRILS